MVYDEQAIGPLTVTFHGKRPYNLTETSISFQETALRNESQMEREVVANCQSNIYCS